MKILVVSDTHGKDSELIKLLLDNKDINMVIHCGDSSELGDYIGEFTDAAVEMVCGNCDLCSPYPYEKTIDVPGHRIFVTHGHMYGVRSGLKNLADRAKHLGADIALYGHTHIPAHDYMYDVHLLNPGSISEPRQAGRRHTYAIITIEGNKTDFSLMSLE